MPSKLSPSEIEAALTGLTGWEYKNGKLRKTFVLGSFVEAFGFMTQVALHAERMNHHPEFFNVYNRVTLDLSTHDVNGTSELDVELARVIDTL